MRGKNESCRHRPWDGVPREGLTPLYCRYLYCNRFTAGPDYRIAAHPHLFWQAEFVKSGILISNVGALTVRQGPGEALLIPPEVTHGFIYEAPGTSVFSVKFEVNGDARTGDPIVLPRNEEVERVRDALDVMLGDGVAPASARRPVADHLCAAILHLFTQTLSEEHSPTPPSLVALVEEFVAGQEGRPVTVAAVSRHLGFSESHVRSQYRKRTGVALKQFIDRHRANVASRYLAYSDIPIKEIVALMEFPDSQCFSRFCRRTIGSPPRRIRKGIQTGTNISAESAT